MALHEISHSLLEGSYSLVAKGAITKESQQFCETYVKYLNAGTSDLITPTVVEYFQKAYTAYNSYKAQEMGYFLGKISMTL